MTHSSSKVPAQEASITARRDAAAGQALNDIGLHEKITAIDSSTPGRYYPIDKLEAHLDNVAHVAISIFVIHENRVLLQQRALTKYHSGGLWANTVCSHPRWQETVEDCAVRRLEEELGWSVPLQKFGEINYAAQVGDLYENEHVHCFVGGYDRIHNINSFNPLEVAAVEWLTVAEILQQIKERPDTFTEWFKIYMTKHREMIIEALSTS